MLALNGQIDEPFLRNLFRIVVMFRIFEIDQISPLQSEDPDPLKLRLMSGNDYSL